MFTRHAHGKRFSDVEDNAFYWNFVVVVWLFLYVLLYWGCGYERAVGGAPQGPQEAPWHPGASP
jgi:hypothetical protein